MLGVNGQREVQCLNDPDYDGMHRLLSFQGSLANIWNHSLDLACLSPIPVDALLLEQGRHLDCLQTRDTDASQPRLTRHIPSPVRSSLRDGSRRGPDSLSSSLVLGIGGSLNTSIVFLVGPPMLLMMVNRVLGFGWCIVRSNYHRMMHLRNVVWLDHLHCCEEGLCATQEHTECQRLDTKDSFFAFSEAAPLCDHTAGTTSFLVQRTIARRSPHHKPNWCPTETLDLHLDGTDWDCELKQSDFGRNLALLAGLVDG